MAKAFNPKSVGVWFPRVVKIELRPFTKYFKGFEKVEAVRKTFGAQTDRVLRSLKVEFFSSKWGYMGVSDEDGHLVVSAYYLRTGKRREIFLDVVPEPGHGRQLREGEGLLPGGFNLPGSATGGEADKGVIAEG